MLIWHGGRHFKSSSSLSLSPSLPSAITHFVVDHFAFVYCSFHSPPLLSLCSCHCGYFQQNGGHTNKGAPTKKEQVWKEEEETIDLELKNKISNMAHIQLQWQPDTIECTGGAQSNQIKSKHLKLWKTSFQNHFSSQNLPDFIYIFFFISCEI